MNASVKHLEPGQVEKTSAVTDRDGEAKLVEVPVPEPTITEPTAPPPEVVAATPAPAKKRRSGWTRLLMLAVPLALVAGGAWAFLTGGRYVGTDNAYVHQALIPVSSDVAGRIVAVDATQNQNVSKGDVLFRLDPVPFEIALHRAEAAVDQARVTVGELRAAHMVAKAQLAAASRALEIRRSEYDRQVELSAKGVATPAALDEMRLALNAAESQVDLARQQLAQAAAALGGDPETPTDEVPAVRAALAEASAARRDLDLTVVKAPADGLIAQIGNLNVGQFVEAGAMAVSLVDTNETWVEANFKETQLETLLSGQPVEVKVDAYSGYKLSGKVDSFSGATGSQFSLIPAQNATGNWVKVVQRLPVRIGIESDAKHPLRDGMSVTVSVDTGKSRLDRIW